MEICIVVSWSLKVVLIKGLAGSPGPCHSKQSLFNLNGRVLSALTSEEPDIQIKENMTRVLLGLLWAF